MRALIIAAFTLGVATQEGVPPQGGDAATIRVGERRAATLPADAPVLPERGPSRAFTLVADQTGTLTIALESLDFDAYLRVEDSAGRVLAESDGGGVETDARLVLEFQAGESYAIHAAVADPQTGVGSGEFLLSVLAGDVPALTGAAATEAAIDHCRRAAQRALERADKRRANYYFDALGFWLKETVRHAEALEAYKQALELARQTGFKIGEQRALRGCVNALIALGELKQAQELAEERLALVRELGDSGALPDALLSVFVTATDPARKRAVATEALERARESGDRNAQARALNNLANNAMLSGERGRAVELYEEALTLCRDLGDDALAADVLSNLGVAHFHLGDRARARECFEQAHAAFVRIGDRSGEARMTGNLGALTEVLGDKSAALEWYRKDLALSREIGDRLGEARALANAGNALYGLGQFAEALDHLEAGLDLARTLGDRRIEAYALGVLGNLAYAMGEKTKARTYAEQYLTQARANGDRSEEARALGHLATLERSFGEPVRAREHFEQAFAIYDEIGERLGGNWILGHLGSIAVDLGDYARARELHELDLALSREGGDRQGEARALAALGFLHIVTGDAQAALESYGQSHQIATDLGDSLQELSSLSGLGLAWQAFGDLEQAQELLERQLEICENLGIPSKRLATLGNLGNVCSEGGKHEQARKYYEASIELARELRDPESELQGMAQLANTLFALGDHAQAAALARQALDALDAGAVGHRLTALKALMRVSLAERDAAGAAAALDEAESLLERPAVGALEISVRAGMRSRFAGWNGMALDLTAQRAAVAETDAERQQILAEGFARSARWKGGALLAGILEQRSGARSAPAQALRKQLREALGARDALLQRITSEVQSGRPAAEIDVLRAEAQAEQERATRLQDELRASFPRDAALDAPPRLDVQALCARLAENTLLVEYGEGQRALYAFVLERHSLRMVELGPLEVVREEVARFEAGLVEPGSLSGPGELAAAGQALYARLLAGSAAPAQLVVVPCASLVGLPFEALVCRVRRSPPAFADIEFVIDRCELVYSPSSLVLLELLERAPRQTAGRVLLLADPLGAAPDPATVVAAAARTDGLALPGARLESRRIAELLLAADEHEVRRALETEPDASGALSGRAFDLYLGSAATRAVLAGDLAPYSVLHFAAHGVVDAARPQRSGLMLAPDGASGLFSIADVLELDLDLDLVVLSACATAAGATLQGEGVQSLARAFLYAGSRGVVASLWPVEDRAAAETMERLYEALRAEGLPPSSALRAAKLAVRRSATPSDAVALRGIGATSPLPAAVKQSREHPFYWAPFVYLGSPR